MTAPTNRPVLSVENLTTSFKTAEGWRAVIRDINVEVNAGETVAIVGESGSGKSQEDCQAAVALGQPSHA